MDTLRTVLGHRQVSWDENTEGSTDVSFATSPSSEGAHEIRAAASF